ncbi:helix-turn-helix domain-containing protein [Streptacidiphilus griseoplanus]|uniref:helix-turn-helix domain-containing protein n=1 Tax=Peterkaempfera griseoplana TaxID=66896 RepID=UPI0006E22E84|nr:helix-turn-helix transcriptional regulator [Peterkaempfera griseoplana]
MPEFRLRADVVRAAAAAHGDTTGRDISARTGLHETTLSHLFSGRRAPSLEAAMAISAAYGTPVNVLVRTVGQPDPTQSDG